MSSTQKRGFRLPWAVERHDDGAPAETLEDAALDARTGAVGDDLGEGPFRVAEGAHDMTTDAAPAAPDVPDQSPEAAMMDADAQSTESPAATPGEPEQAHGGWPATDRRGPDRPFTAALPETRLPRRDNPLVAGLVKAMREAAVASRDETTARLAAEATARIEAIRARATTEATGLRKRADDDVSAIREWSKAEMARVRQETEDRIEARRAELAAETERHAASVDRLVADVETTVAAFEADMERFFTQLLAESDPARLATLAEQAPDPPDLRGEGPPATDLMDEPQPVAESETGAEATEVEAEAEATEVEAEAEATEVEAEAEGTEVEAEAEATEVEAEAEATEAEAGLEADAAAEAEAEATEGLDPSASAAWPTAALAATRRQDAVPSPADANGPDSTRLLVSGLTSVAGISAFKGALGQLRGVRAVSVSSGEKGVFVFTVSHDPGVDLDSGVASLTGFAARVTDATDDGFTVAAHEPAA